MGDMADDLADREFEGKLRYDLCKQDYMKIKDEDLIDELKSLLIWSDYDPDEFTSMMKSIISLFDWTKRLTEKQRNVVIIHICMRDYYD